MSRLHKGKKTIKNIKHLLYEDKSQLTWERALGDRYSRQFLEILNVMECALYTSENPDVP